MEGTTMDVALLTPDWEKAWGEFVEDSQSATLGHLLGWRNVVEKTYHHRPYYLMAINGQALAGILPLFVIRSPLFGRFLVTAPYLSHGGVLANEASTACALVRAAQDLAMEQCAQYAEIRGLRRVDQGLLLKDKYCTFFLPLALGSEAIWERFEGRARKAVRKAQKANLVVVRGAHLVEPFVDIISHHMRDLGTPFHRANFYRNILANFPNQSEILMVCRAGQYLGGVLLVTSKDTIFPLYGGVLTKYRVFAPMSLLVWETIRYGCERGFSYLDFGRSRWGSGTFFFKRQWSAQPVPLFYEYYLTGDAKMPDMDPMNPRYRLLKAAWRHLPLYMAKAIGHLVIRDIA
jgi:serine/alanine adding enzyme